MDSALTLRIANENGQSLADKEISTLLDSSPIHQIVLTLEKRGLITRTPGAARSIRLLLPHEEIPTLRFKNMVLSQVSD